jgi:hypothetical protein
MENIKCLDNYKWLKEMLLKGYRGDADFFSKKLNISRRTFFRLLFYLKEIDNLEVVFNKKSKVYYLK